MRCRHECSSPSTPRTAVAASPGCCSSSSGELTGPQSGVVSGASCAAEAVGGSAATSACGASASAGVAFFPPLRLQAAAPIASLTCMVTSEGLPDSVVGPTGMIAVVLVA